MSEKQIKKYQLEKVEERTGYASFTRVDIPKGGKVIGVSLDEGFIYLHIIANHNHKKKERWFAIFEENMPMEDYEKKTCEYLGKIDLGAIFNYLYIFEVHD